MKSAEKRDLKKLNRGELLDIILQLKKRGEALEQELSDAKSRLGRREVLMEKAGSIAEASLALNGIFETAQQAVDTYTSSVRLNYSSIEEKCAQAELERQQMLQSARLEADKILSDARLQSADIVEEAERTASEREAAFYLTVEKVLSAHSELKKLLE